MSTYRPVSKTGTGEFDRYEKCSWIVKAKIGAPTFQIINSSLNANFLTNWELHYVEYDDTIKMKNKGTNDFILFSENNVGSNIYIDKNRINGKMYDKE